jgi:hypothetical protein
MEEYVQPISELYPRVRISLADVGIGLFKQVSVKTIMTKVFKVLTFAILQFFEISQIAFCGFPFAATQLGKSLVIGEVPTCFFEDHLHGLEKVASPSPQTAAIIGQM